MRSVDKKVKKEIFPSVEVTKKFLGISVGTILGFDSASGKYISAHAEEDIADESYYYSGHAIALDPTVIKNNMGEYFEYTKPEAKGKLKVVDAGVYEEPVEYTKEWKKEEEFKNMPEEWHERNKVPVEEREEFTLAPDSPVPEVGELGKATIVNAIEEGTKYPPEEEEDITPIPEDAVVYNTPEAMLTFECGLCHAKNAIHKMRYGLFFPVAEETRLNLKCENCGIETTVFYELI